MRVAMLRSNLDREGCPTEGMWKGPFSVFGLYPGHWPKMAPASQALCQPLQSWSTGCLSNWFLKQRQCLNLWAGNRVWGSGLTLFSLWTHWTLGTASCMGWGGGNIWSLDPHPEPWPLLLFQLIQVRKELQIGTNLAVTPLSNLCVSVLSQDSTQVPF